MLRRLLWIGIILNLLLLLFQLARPAKADLADSMALGRIADETRRLADATNRQAAAFEKIVEHLQRLPARKF